MSQPKIHASALSLTEAFQVVASDETTALTTGAAKVTFRMPYAFTLTYVRGSLTTAQASGTPVQFDVKMNGTSIFSTLPTFDNTEKTTTTAATPGVLSNTTLTDDSEITVSVTAVDGATAAAGLKVSLIGARA